MREGFLSSNAQLRDALTSQDDAGVEGFGRHQFENAHRVQADSRQFSDVIATFPVQPAAGSRGRPAIVWKFLLDQVAGFMIMLAVLPLFLILAAAIKVSSKGPVLFTQRRHGHHGRTFSILKFRTMIVHNEPAGIVTQASRDDKRITAVGRFLRRTSLDELPQIFNVVRGDMSLVGPRPHAVEHNLEFRSEIPGYMTRHQVKPGVTGWAQVSGHRGAIKKLADMQARFEHDVWYINHWSPWLDIKILLLTVYKGFVHPNAF
jgi:exopolysaccharide biosynthesis polyprenyl glycosylphosphotransferase